MANFLFPFRFYTPIIFVANIISLAYFFINLLIFPFLNPLYFPYVYITISVICITASALCFGDFILWEQISFRDYEITEEERHREIKLTFYSLSSFYLGLSIAMSIIPFFLQIVKNADNLPDKNFRGVLILIIILYFIAVIAILLSLGLGFSNLFSDVKKFKKNVMLMSPLPFIMIAGGEDIINYIVLILWISAGVKLVRERKKTKMTFKQFWALKNELTTDLMAEFRRPYEKKTVFVLNFPVMLFLFVFVVALAGVVDFTFTTVTVVILLYCYMFSKVGNNKFKKVKWSLTIFILIGLLTFYFYYINKALYTLFDPSKEFLILNYKIHDVALLLFSIGVCFAFYFYYVNTLKVKARVNSLYRIQSYIFSIESLTYILPLLIAIFAPQFGILWGTTLLVALIIFLIFIFLDFKVFPKQTLKDLKSLIEYREKEVYRFLEARMLMKFSIIARRVRCLLLKHFV
ncbi:MAG: hypothetical protein ACTSYD_08630 [Candidatus Heimdallarchaeaceae archaeon]